MQSLAAGLRVVHAARVKGNAQSFKPWVMDLPEVVTVHQALLALRDEPGLAALDSGGGKPCAYSWVAFAPVTRADGWGGWDELRSSMSGWNTEGKVPGPFQGGFIGALAYDLGVHGEDLDLPIEPWEQPRMVGGLYLRFLVFDHVRGTQHLVLPHGPAVEAEAAEICARLAAENHPDPFGVGDLRRHTSPSEHQARIETARGDIAAGEYYQVNLAHRFTAPMQGDPLDLYLRLRVSNPAPYGGYLRFKGGACLSTSPELLLDFDSEEMKTRPIKGTAPRLADPAADAESMEALRNSEKERAELAMIVDLERNDLGRMAQIGSVSVDQFPELESYARVHHLVATVRAKPRSEVDAIDTLQAIFPGGSITGAPKLASMEAIAKLEGEGRGLFTGSLGYLDFTGRAHFNILIRTVLWRPGSEGGREGEISFRVGGGITYASNAQAEEEETLHKAQGMTDAWNPAP